MPEKFKILKRKVIFSKGPIHLVDCEIKMPGGNVLSRQILEHPGAVVIIPIPRKGRVLLIRQFRFAAKSWIWEFPAGGIEPGESIQKAATRELIEEIGMRPGKLTPVMKFYPTPGISGEIMYLFKAEKLSPAVGKPDEDEDIEVAEFSLTEVFRMIRKGKIIDAKTILGFWSVAS
ncbi:MAG: NUDIX hydrolase [Candidatus Omnitrophica bacterium]|nr:NUDIX hydrolase [Candidatus Omnitrophota bacterium]